VRILLDDNMPESLRRALVELGHEVDSVASLRLKGIDNGRLYQEVAHRYDLCFSKDRSFVQSVRAIDRPGAVRGLRVTIAQAPRGRFTQAFVEARTRRLLEPARLLDEWVTNFPIKLRPKLNPRRFRAPAPGWWQHARLEAGGSDTRRSRHARPRARLFS